MSRRAQRKNSKRKRRRSARRRSVLLGSILLLALGGTAVWLAWPFWQLSAQLTSVEGEQPSRLFGRPMRLTVDEYLRLESIVEELEHLGYRSVDGTPQRGQFRRQGGRLGIHLRSFPTGQGFTRPALLEIDMSGRRVADLRLDGAETVSATLEPPLLASFLGPGRRQRVSVALSEVPEHLIYAVLAAEDANFFNHAGLSLTGILRAAWVNLRGGSVSQGGSTLTQQLVKNVFLTHERTWARKLREVVLALLVDLRYDKQIILETYLNEIYWGTDGAVNLMGIGSAAWGYFGKRPDELDLCESAVLAAVIRSPGSYSPAKHPQRVMERRNLVLRRMTELGWLAGEELEPAVGKELCYAPRTVPARQAPHFADFAADEAARRFGVDPRSERGLSLLSTIDRSAQVAANEAVAWGLDALEKGWERRRESGKELEAALISADPRSGQIRAYVGGRDYGRSQFDRVRQAERQAGSAFKPVVYAAAFAAGAASPITLVEDSPITVALAGQRWSPQNSDGEYRGWVTARTALEKSLNIPTVRIALAASLPRVVRTAHDLGIRTDLRPFPALALGAFEVTPLDLATVYSSLASGGVRRELYGLEAVLDADGVPVSGADIASPERVLEEETAHQVTAVLQGVLDRGTARSVRDQGIQDLLAGKTGTTNDRRDSWFVGYSPDQATLVWVGYDDSSTTNLSGARAALPIWGRYTWKVRPTGGYGVFQLPAGMSTAVIDPVSGQLATSDCPEVLTEVFTLDSRPSTVCRLHSSWGEWELPREQDRYELERNKRRFRWLRKLFKRGRDG